MTPVRYVVGRNPRLEMLTASGVWEAIPGVKAIHPLVDATDPDNPTLGRVEFSALSVVTEAQVAPPSPAPAALPAPSAEPDPPKPAA